MPLPRIYEAGVCPYCGDTDIDYDYNEMFGDIMTWFFECNNCKERSTEVYSIQYQYTEGENNA